MTNYLEPLQIYYSRKLGSKAPMIPPAFATATKQYSYSWGISCQAKVKLNNKSSESVVLTQPLLTYELAHIRMSATQAGDMGDSEGDLNVTWRAVPMVSRASLHFGRPPTPRIVIARRHIVGGRMST
jgi:hypothetical protein